MKEAILETQIVDQYSIYGGNILRMILRQGCYPKSK